MKILALVTIASVLGATSVWAQDTTIVRREGDMGSRTVIRHSGGDMGSRTIVKRSSGPKIVIHRHDRGELRTGSIGGCKTVVVKKTNAMGDSVTKRIKKCG